MKPFLKILACAAILAVAATWVPGAPALGAPAAEKPSAEKAPAAAGAPAAAATLPAATQPAKAPDKPGDPAAAEKLIAVVKTVAGTVESRTAVGQPWTAVKVGDHLTEGMDVRTGFRARCVVEMNKNTVQVDPLAVIRIGELRRQGDTVRTRILLKQGNTESNVERGGTKNDFAIVTPTATLSVRGTHGVETGFFPAFGGSYGLTGDGLTNLANTLTGQRTSLAPGQTSNDNVTPPAQVLAQQYQPLNIDPLAFSQTEQNANARWHTSLPAPPALGGSTPTSPTLNTAQSVEQLPPPPTPPSDDYGPGYGY
jgi:hypothetical protein